MSTSAYRSSGAVESAPPPLFLPPHLSHLSQHLNHLSQPFFPLKGWGAPCPCCPKEEARSSSVAELRRKAHEHSAALLHSLARVTSITTVFVNKALLSGSVSLEAPLFITWCQCIVSFTICYILSSTGGIPRVFSFPKGSPWNTDVVKKVIPLSIMFTLMISTNNLCLKYVDVSFYYIGRSLTTVFNVVFSFLLLGQKTSLRCIVCCMFIIFGFILGVDQEKLLGSFSLVGTIFGILGSLALSLYSIYTKRVLPLVNQEVWLLSYYNNAYSILLFLPLMVVNGEISVLLSYKNFGSWFFWFQMFVGGLCGFAIGFFTSLQIKVTSPLTHNISGTAKACAQTVLATQWYSETKNMLWWASNIVVLASSALYARFKQIEMEQDYRRELPEKKKLPI